MAQSDQPVRVVRWWLTSMPLTIIGLNAEPFVLVVLIPLVPWWPFIQFIGWVTFFNVLLSWIFQKSFVQFLYYMKREFFNNRRRIYSTRYSLQRFKGK